MANALTDAQVELEAGVHALGLSLDGTQVDRLLAYQGLLAEWNRAYNLAATRDAGGMLTHHLLGSLSAAPRIAELARRAQPDAPRVLDISSGNGPPSIPLAIAFPDVSVTMVSTVQKKAAFLTQYHTELGLVDAQSYWDHVEGPTDATDYGAIASRAFTELADFVNLAGYLPAPGSRMVAMKGVRPDAEVKRLFVGWTVEAIERLTMPGLPAKRHPVVLAPSA